MPDPITVELNQDEALVLVALLNRFCDYEILDIEDHAEEKVLWNLQCFLHQRMPDVEWEMIEAARARMRECRV